VDRQYVGIDFHRRRSVIVRLSADGERLGLHRIVNDPFELVQVIGLCGESPEVVIEATYGWYWAVDLLQELGAVVHLARNTTSALDPTPLLHTCRSARVRRLDRGYLCEGRDAEGCRSVTLSPETTIRTSGLAA
jgi:hypothetical protein